MEINSSIGTNEAISNFKKHEKGKEELHANNLTKTKIIKNLGFFLPIAIGKTR